MLKVIFDTKPDAFMICDIANSCIKDLGRISVNVLYGLCCMYCEPDEEQIGWTDISNAKIIRELDGYAIHFSDPIDVKPLKLEDSEFTDWFRLYRIKTGI